MLCKYMRVTESQPTPTVAAAHRVTAGLHCQSVISSCCCSAALAGAGSIESLSRPSYLADFANRLPFRRRLSQFDGRSGELSLSSRCHYNCTQADIR